MRTKYQIVDALRAESPGRNVETDLVHDVMCAIADDLEAEATGVWSEGARLRQLADVLRGKRSP